MNSGPVYWTLMTDFDDEEKKTMNCIHGWPWDKPITVPGVPPQMCCTRRETTMRNDMQFAEAEELVQNDIDDEEMADLEAFMTEEEERNDYARQQAAAALVDGLEALGIATAEEVAEIAKKYGVTE